ncbi:MAG: DUF2321 domain-containing protein [Erysipelotrichaceae bacterium]|nr:DUF2321 domain-containing protein [Erysipelotrichaceae bacterium]
MSYHTAYICKKGHVLSFWKPCESKFCPECGSEVISECPNCHTQINGDDKDIMVHSKYRRPYYCPACGKPYPWTQSILDNAVELVSLDDNLSDEIKSIIINAIPDLIVESSSTPLAEARFKKYISFASDIVKDGLKQMFSAVLTEVFMTRLFS